LHCDCIAFNTIAKGIRKTITGKKNIYLKKQTAQFRKRKEHMTYGSSRRKTMRQQR
jgi:hypothetical protein